MQSRPSTSATTGAGSLEPRGHFQSLPLVSAPRVRGITRAIWGKARVWSMTPPPLPPWFGKVAPAPGQELLPGRPGHQLTHSSAVPAEAPCPGFCSTWPAGELGEAGAGMCAGPAPARPLRH